MSNLVYGGLAAGFWKRKPLIGMVHLGPLPGSARYDADALPLGAVLARAEEDARALAEGGADAIMVENFFDAPFAKDSVPPHTLAALTRAVLAVRAAAGPDLPLGVNCLRNDARSALAVAHVCGAQFVRINVYVGAAVTDQGIIEGAARTAVLYRRELGADVAIFADVFVKHAAQLGDGSVRLEDAAKDAVLRGLADALILSGAATGSATDPDELRRVRAVLPDAPLLVGSGMSAQSSGALLAYADGAIVGTSLKENGDVSAPVDPARVRALRAAMDAAAGARGA
ncbi:MAG TPA: BtpA/SgcQ family protein [Armatimonadaceae bacterium]|nr:BtpA/SgcQ family protein [Armatimonadaceae bacterium]